MSLELINRSPDLKRLRDEGYEVEVRGGFLLVSGIPYLDRHGNVHRGTLVSVLDISGGQAIRPKKHIVSFIGEHPCRKDGTEIGTIHHSSAQKDLGNKIVVDRTFSNKPADGYADFYEKMTRYIEIISAPVRSLHPEISAKTFKVIESTELESVFRYLDTNSSRAEIDRITDKLKSQKIAIIGLGGTGSYVLDLVAKTPVEEIHIYDGDAYLQHNAFRSPGAPSVEELDAKPLKVDHFAKIYSQMRRNIFVHPQYVHADELPSFAGFSCVFICVDLGGVKRPLIESLEAAGITYVDVGMGIEVVNDSLTGIVRTTAGSAKLNMPITERGRISFAEADGDDDYDTNIQIAELNALNASIAVIWWKKQYGFYADVAKEHNTLYTINDNELLNDGA